MSALLELKEAREKLDGTRQKLSGLMEKKDDAGKLKWAPEDHDSFKALGEQAKAEHAEVKKWEEIEEVDRKNREAIEDGRRPASGNPMSVRRDDGHDLQAQYRSRKSIGQMAVESESYRNFRARNIQVASVELDDYGKEDFKAAGGGAEFKTTMTSSAGFTPFVTRGPDVVPYALRRTMVQDLMPSFPITEYAIQYMEETTWTGNAAPVAEAGTKPESARALTARTVNAEVIATTLPVTEQQMQDIPFLMAYINATLAQEVELAEEAQLLTGNGSTPNLQGFLTKTGVQTQAKGADSVPTAFVKALTLVRFTGYAEPDASVWHPNDWQDVLTLQDADGRYIFGDPSSINVNSLWGVPVVVTPAETENTVLIGAFRMFSYIIRRTGLRIDIGWINDNFAKNIKTIRAELRAGLVIRRPSAFVKLTGA